MVVIVFSSFGMATAPIEARPFSGIILDIEKATLIIYGARIYADSI